MKADKAKDLTVEELSDELEDEYSTNTKKPNRWLRNLLFTLLVLIILALGTVGGAFLFIKQSLSPVLSQTTTSTSASIDNTGGAANTDSAGQADNNEGFQGVEFEVKPGWGASRVASALEADGFIKNGQIFSLWLRYKGYDRGIGEGLYYISPKMSSIEIAEVLKAGGQPRTRRVIIPEGFRTIDIAKRLNESGFGREKDFIYYMRNPSILKEALGADYLPDDGTLEGYLFPATYDIPHDADSLEALSQLIRRFEVEMDLATLERVNNLGLTKKQWVILASIVQSEAGSEEEMPIITGVFFNRLELGMALQSDPTVAYGLGKDLTELDRSAGDFTEAADHPWNTYTRPGFPVGPISNPGNAALQAVLNPVRTNENGQEYLYFLHGRDGNFYPNISFDDHNRDVATYLR